MGPPPEPSEAVPVGRGRRNGAERSPRRQAGTEWAEFLLTMWGLDPPWSGHILQGLPFYQSNTSLRGHSPWPSSRRDTSGGLLPAAGNGALLHLKRTPFPRFNTGPAERTPEASPSFLHLKPALCIYKQAIDINIPRPADIRPTLRRF